MHNSQFPSIVTNSRTTWTMALLLRYQAQRLYILRIIKFGAGQGDGQTCGSIRTSRQKNTMRHVEDVTKPFYASLFSIVPRTYNRSQSHVEQTRSSTRYACKSVHRYGTVSFIFQSVFLKFSDLLPLWKIVRFPDFHRGRNHTELAYIFSIVAKMSRP